MDEIAKKLSELYEASKKEGVVLLDVIKANPALKPDLFQKAFDEGHGVATAAAVADHDKLNKRASDAETSLLAANKKIEKLSETNPDVAKIHEQYAAEIKRLQGLIVEADERGTVRVSDVKRETAISLIEAHLVALGVDPDYAEALAVKQATRDRVKVDEKAATYQIMQADKAIPYAGSEREQIKAIAEELKSKITNPHLLKSKVPGDGTGKETATGAGEGEKKPETEKKEYFDSIRKNAEKEFSGDKRKSATERLAERTGKLR